MSTVDEAPSVYDLSARWWVLVIRGIAAILFGIATLAMPGISLLALVLLWGAYAIFDGVVNLALAVSAGRAGQRWGWYLIDGLIGIAAGLAAFLVPGLTALTLVFVIGFWAVLSGIAEIVLAIELRELVEGEWLLALSGILSIGFGVLLFVAPGAGALALVVVIAGYAILYGVLLAVLGVRLERWRRADERTFSGGAPSNA